MSFTLQPPAPARPNRCQLFVPGSRMEIFEKAAASAADVVNIDLEDSVSPNDKDQARKNAIEGINDIDWGQKTLSVRINGLDTPFWHRDVIDVLEQTNGRLDLFMIPKAGNAKDIYAVDALVTAVEATGDHGKQIGFEAIIETAPGLKNCDEIAAASPRLQALSLGAADYAASMGMQTTGIGGTQSDYYMVEDALEDAADVPRMQFFNDPWHYPIVKIVAACRTHGLLPVDGPFGDIGDDEAYRAQARRVATLGCAGKWAIHPRQIALANSVFTPSEAKVAEAREILKAMEEAQAAGLGATVYKGRLVDIASIKQAEVIVRQMELIGAST